MNQQSNFPKAHIGPKLLPGHYIAVTKISIINSRTGKVELLATKPHSQRVDRIYSDGRVRMESGDVWTVGRNSSGWFTIK